MRYAVALAADSQLPRALAGGQRGHPFKIKRRAHGHTIPGQGPQAGGRNNEGGVFGRPRVEGCKRVGRECGHETTKETWLRAYVRHTEVIAWFFRALGKKKRKAGVEEE